MFNETLFIISTLVSVLFIFFASRRGIECLFGIIIANLILVGIFGTKLITVFGLTTNAANVFYACVFLATHFILERYSKREGMKTIWLGVCSVVFFVIMSQLATRFNGLSLSNTANESISTLFTLSIRVMLASLLAYIFAQHINILIYEKIKSWTKGKFLWLRINGANIIAQFVDSLLFFSIAFYDSSGPVLVQAILMGWLIKTVVVAIGTPFLYLDSFIERKKI